MNDDIKLQCLTTLDQIRAIEAEWHNLLEQTNCYRMFLAPIWFISACEAFNYQPYVFIARQQQKLTTIFALGLAQQPLEHEINTLGYPGIHITDAIDMMVHPDHAEHAIALLGYILTQADMARRLYLRDIRLSSNLLWAMSELNKSSKLQGTKLSYQLTERSVEPWIDCPDGWNVFLQSKSGHFRKRLRYTLKRLAEHNLTLELLAADSPDCQRVADLFLTYHLANLAGKSHFSQIAAQHVIRKSLPSLLSRNYVWALIIRDHRGDIRGIDLNTFADSEAVLGFMQGYDPRLEHLSLGRALFIEAVHQACDLGATRYSFGRNQAPLKERMQTELDKTYNLSIDIPPA